MLMDPTVEDMMRAAFEDALAQMKTTGRTSRTYLPGLYEVRQPVMENGAVTQVIHDRPDRKIWVTIYVSEE